MKHCAYCGCENTDDARVCRTCRTPLVPEPGASETSEPPTPDEAARALAEKRMRNGAIWCVGGILVTVISYMLAASSPYGGTYIVAWGAVIYGAVQCVRGWSGKAHQPSTEDMGYEALAYGTRLETEGRIQEAMGVYQEIAAKYPDTDAGRDAKQSLENLRAKRA